MWAVLPLGALVLTIVFIHGPLRRGLAPGSWRFAILGGATFWGACIVLITEGLSLFHALDGTMTALSWMVVCTGLACGLVFKSRPTCRDIENIGAAAGSCDAV